MIVAAPDTVTPPNFRQGAPPTRHQVRRTALVRRLAAGLSGVALDYGCGWGDLAAMLAPQFTRMVGVDTGEARVAFAAAEYPGIEFSRCRPDGTDFAGATFDVVLSIVVLHFVPSDEAYLAECRRLLKPGGTLVLVLQNPESMWMVGRRLLGRNVFGAGEGGTSLRAVRTFVARHGFVIEMETGFYDPARDAGMSLRQLLIGALNGIGHALRLPRLWSYVGFRCVLAG